MIDDLYSAKVLALAANMPRAGRLAAPQGSSEKVSKLCGSRVTVDVVIEDERLAAAMGNSQYLEATRDVLRKNGELWFNDESYVISRQADPG